MNKNELREIIIDVLTSYCCKPFTGNFDKDVDMVFKDICEKYLKN